MPRKRYARDMLSQVLQKRAESKRRWQPLTAEDLKDEHPLHALTDLVTSWAPRDIRLDSLYQQSHNVDATDDEHMTLMSESMEVRVHHKDLTDNILVCAVEIQSNKDMYDRYNEAVEAHNQKWMDAGCPTTVVNPATGEISEIEDTYVDPVLPSSKHNQVPESLYESASHGKLAKARPTMKRKVLVYLHYKLIIIEDEVYVVEYAVKTPQDKILLWGVERGLDLADIIRRTVQQIWGHTSLHGDRGPFLDGITMLMQGKKLALCKGYRHLSWVHGTVAPQVDSERVGSAAEKHLAKVGHIVLGYLIPMGSFLGIIWLLLHCLLGAYGDEPRDMTVTFFGTLLGLVAVSYVSLKLGGMCMDHHERLRNQQRLA